MRNLKWSISHAVFVPDLDDEHKEIFEAVGRLQQSLADPGLQADTLILLDRLLSSMAEHFAHEERLMRAARYGSLRWHKQQHNGARRRVEQFAARVRGGDAAAGNELLTSLSSWLHDHTRLADRMLGAFLRNERRGLWKLTFEAGTKPRDTCEWVDSRGEPFHPPVPKQSL